MVFQKSLQRRTRGHRDMHDLTEELEALVRESGIATGLASLCNVGSTAALGAIEFEPGLQLRPRARLARRQRPFPPPGDRPGPEPDGAGPRRPTAPGHLAAGLPAR